MSYLDTTYEGKNYIHDFVIDRDRSDTIIYIEASRIRFDMKRQNHIYERTKHIVNCANRMKSIKDESCNISSQTCAIFNEYTRVLMF